MARAPSVPPISTPLVDRDGKLTQAWYQYLTGERTYATNVNSGATAAATAAANAAAQAAAAQAAAQAASSTAQAVGSNAFAVAVDTAYVEVVSAASGLLTTDAATVTPSGGTAPYTYLWSRDSGDIVNITTDTAASTTFSGDPGTNGTLTGNYKCVVTDAAAATATIYVGVTIANILITG